MMFKIIALCALPIVTAHSWIEQLMVLAPNGTMVGQPGYARGNVHRGTPGFSDPVMVNLIPPDGREVNEIYSTDLICKNTQTIGNQTDGSPALQAAPGAGIALRYQENGHVTLPQNQPGKPNNRGTLYVYGTTQPSPNDTLLGIHRVWNAEGTGGDGRGVLLSTSSFDDGQCYQINSGSISTLRQQEFPHTADQLMGANLWCQQDIVLPSNISSAYYTLYWIWDWPTMPGTPGFPNGKQELYTTCMDIEITDSSSLTTDAFSKGIVHFEQGQDLNSAGIESQVQDILNPTAVTDAETIPFGSVTSGGSQPSESSAVSPASPPTTLTVVPVGQSATVPAFQPTQAPTQAFAGGLGSSGSGQANVVTVTEYVATVHETVVQTVSGNAKRSVATSACSKKHPAFRLKARNAYKPYDSEAEC